MADIIKWDKRITSFIKQRLIAIRLHIISFNIDIIQINWDNNLEEGKIKISVIVAWGNKCILDYDYLIII